MLMTFTFENPSVRYPLSPPRTLSHPAPPCIRTLSHRSSSPHPLSPFLLPSPSLTIPPPPTLSHHSSSPHPLSPFLLPSPSLTIPPSLILSHPSSSSQPLSAPPSNTHTLSLPSSSSHSMSPFLLPTPSLTHPPPLILSFHPSSLLPPPSLTHAPCPSRTLPSSFSHPRTFSSPPPSSPRKGLFFVLQLPQERQRARASTHPGIQRRGIPT